MASTSKSNKESLNIGLDIGGGFIRAVKISDTAGIISLKDFIIASLPNDIPQDVMKIASSLKSIISKLDDKNSRISSIISGSEVVIKRLTLPKMNSDLIIEALKWELKNYITFPLDKATIDFSIIGTVRVADTEKLDILAVIVPSKYIEDRMACLDASGIKTDKISIIPVSIWTLLKKTNLLQNDSAVTCFINIGAETTTIVFFKGKNLEFYRELYLAGNNFTKILTSSEKFDLSEEEAETIKKSFGIPDEDSQETTEKGISLSLIRKAIQPVLRIFVNEISRSISYYKDQFQKSQIDRVIIAGGTSKLRNLDKILFSTLNIKIEHLDDLIGNDMIINNTSSENIKDVLPHLSIAIGTALSGEDDINLLKSNKGSGKTGSFAGIESAISNLTKSIPMLKPVKESMGMSTDNDFAKNLVKSILPATFGILALIIAIVAIANLNIGKNIDNYKRSIDERKVTLNNLRSYATQKSNIDKLNGNRRPVGNAIIELSNILPKDVSLDTINFNGSMFTIDGRCKQMDTVSSTIKIIQNATFLQSPQLIQAKRSLIEVQSGKNKVTKSYVQFQMTFAIK